MRRLAAILAADVVGYSRLMAADEAGTHARLKALRHDFIEPTITEHRGRIVKLTGDGALIEFASVVDAVECAVAIQDGVAQRQAALPEHLRLAFRIGINIGDIIIEDDDIYGGGVNIAARLEQLAEPGGICVARNVYNQVRDKAAVRFESMGEHRVKNIPEPITAYRVIGEAGSTAMLPVVGGTRRPGWRVAALTAAVVVPLGAGVAWFWPYPDWRLPAVGEEAARAVALDTNRLAVLPFANISAHAEDEYFSDGITEELISRLSRLHELTVIARTSVMQYKDTTKSIAEIGQELRVGTVLEGSVRKAGDRLRIIAQLIDVASQGHLWSEDYDRQMEDVFAVQSDVAQQVAEALKVSLLPGEKERLDRQDTENLPAYNLYLKGFHHWHKLTRDNLQKARSYFEEAISLDPSYAQAYAWLAFTYQVLGEFGHMAAKEAYPKAKEAANQALQIDPTSAEAYAVLATVRGYYDWDWAGSEAAYKRAIEVNPNSVVAHWNYGILLLTPMLRHEEAIAELRLALELEPLSPWIGADLAWALNSAGRYEEAIAASRSAIDLDPNFPLAHASLGYAFLQMGRYEEALAELQQEVDLTAGEPFATARLGWAYGVAGRTADAQGVLAEMKARAEREHVDPLVFVWLYAGLDDKEEAFTWLERAYEERSSWIINLQAKDYYARLRSDPRFDELLRRIDLSSE